MDSDTSPSKKAGRGRGRGRGGTGGVRGRPRGRGRGKRAVKLILSDDEASEQEEMLSASDRSLDAENEKPSTVDEITPSLEITPKPPEFDLADISQLQAPTFTTLNRGPPEPMLRLDWTLPVNLIGEKVSNPMIHCCDKCLKPILIYGRLIPCKHVYCLACGRQEEGKPCPRCRERVVRVEQTGLAQLFMCTHGGSRYGHDGCRRTYLSQRDLQAHVSHRHLRMPREPQKISTVSSSRGGSTGGSGPGGGVASGSSSQHIPVLNSRSNLVSVPIQDSSPVRPSYANFSGHSIPPASSVSGYNTYHSSYTNQQTQASTMSQYNPSSTGTTGSYYSTGFNSMQQPPPPPPAATLQYDSNPGGSFQQWSGAANQAYYR